MVKSAPHAALTMPAPEFGRYEVVLEGSAIIEGHDIGPPGFRYVRNDDPVEPIFSGDAGASIAFLWFDKDALEGGITGEEGLAVEAAAAMARAI